MSSPLRTPSESSGPTAVSHAILPRAVDAQPTMDGEGLLHRRDLWLLCLAAFIAMMLSKTGTLLPGMSVDDYSYVFDNSNGSTTYNLISQGRGLNALLFLAANSLNTSFASVSEFSFLLASAMIALAIAGSITLVKHDKTNQVHHYVAAALAATHPYLTSYFLFRMSLINHAFVYATLFATLWLIARQQTLWRQLTCILLLAACAHISQIILILFAISAGAWSLARYCRGRKNGVPPLNEARGIVSFVVILGSATVLYFLSSAVVQSIMHVSATPVYSIHIRVSVLNSIQAMFGLAYDALLGNETIIPAWLKIWVLAALTTSIALCFARNRVRGIACLVLLVCGTLATVSTMALSWGYLVPRTFSPIGLCLALTFCLACDEVGPYWTRKLCVALVIPIIAFCFTGASLFYQQLLLTQWDQRTAAAIYDRITQQAPEGTPIHIVAEWPIHTQPLSYKGSGINESALLNHWSYPGLFAIVTGEKLKITGGDRSMCKGIPAWPNPGSTKRLADGSMLVCMVR